jgi:hypothetical protein
MASYPSDTPLRLHNPFAPNVSALPRLDPAALLSSATVATSSTPVFIARVWLRTRFDFTRFTVFVFLQHQRTGR